MTAIALCYATTPLLQYLQRWNGWLLIALLLAGVFEFVYLRFLPFHFSWFWLYSIAYCIAGLSSRHRALLSALLVAVLLCLLALVSWKIVLDYDHVLNRVLHNLTGLVVCSAGIPLLSRLPLQRLSALVQPLDRLSYPVYITHQVFLLGPLAHTAPFSLADILSILCLTAASALLLDYVAAKCRRWLE